MTEKAELTAAYLGIVSSSIIYDYSDTTHHIVRVYSSFFCMFHLNWKGAMD